ncbi:MAG: CysO-cysteine peptidase [Syntrophorhabdaceae bacterium PtaU1.Bin034]|nr:MAG: CysO-cysteine peptidase [Syntrophorhabdaceae bacterium PtaU1.Bin034]
MIIDRDIIEQMIAHAEQEAPIEACGYLAGIGGRVTRRYPLTNAEGREDHYTADPVEQFAVHKAVRQEGLEILAAYHSHPVTPARPSAEDIRLAHDPDLLYIIVSLAGEKKSVKGFYIREGEVSEEPLVVES